MKIVNDSGIIGGGFNGSNRQTLQLEVKGLIFRIYIYDESHENQSYTTLEVLNRDLTWTQLDRKHPKIDYNISTAYYNNISPQTFEPIIKDFKKLIKEQYAPILSQGFYNQPKEEKVIKEDTKQKPKKQKVTL